MSYLLNTGTPAPITIFLDSRFASQFIEEDTNGFKLTTNFIYQLKEPINVPNNMNVLLQLNSATIPYSFYNIRDVVNNAVFFYLRDNRDASITYGYVLLNEGNYTSNSLATELKTQLEAEISGSTFTITYDRKIQKFRFQYANTNAHFHKFALSFTTTTIANEVIAPYVGHPANQLLGIRDNTELEITINNHLFSNMVVDINDNIHGLYIRQNLATKQTLDNSTGVLSNILERIPITTNAGGVIFYNNENGHKTMIDTNHIQNIGIRLTDDKHRSIDLNGLNFQISLVISFIYKEHSKIELTKNTRRIMENVRLMDEKIPIDNSKKLKITKKPKNQKNK